MITIMGVTLRGFLRDRIFQGIMMAALVFLIIPSASVLSMRQVAELSMTLSLSLNSFILLLLSVFLGGTALWKDIEKRYTYSVLGLPISRGRYLLGRFGGTVLFLMLTSLVLGTLAVLVVFYSSLVYPPDKPIVWGYVLLCLLFDVMKYALLVAFAFLYSTVSTSFFLPVFGTIATFLVGGATQQVFDYIHTPAGEQLAPTVRNIASGLYYALPNFGAFDLKVNAIYGVAPSNLRLLLTFGYFLIYAAFLLLIAMLIISRREMR